MSEWLVRGLVDIGLSTRQVWAAIIGDKRLVSPRDHASQSDYFGQTVDIARATMRALRALMTLVL